MILKIVHAKKKCQLTCDDVRDKLFRSGLLEAGRFLEAHRDGESGFWLVELDTLEWVRLRFDSVPFFCVGDVFDPLSIL